MLLHNREVTSLILSIQCLHSLGFWGLAALRQSAHKELRLPAHTAEPSLSTRHTYTQLSTPSAFSDMWVADVKYVQDVNWPSFSTLALGCRRVGVTLTLPHYARITSFTTQVTQEGGAT